MGSTSAAELARQILEDCLAGRSWSEDVLARLVRLAADDPEASRAFFGVLIERLADLFEPHLCTTYARLFSRAIEWIRPGVPADDLFDRYQSIRTPRRCTVDPEHIFVLSRVTLGADVAVTSVVMEGLKRRFPRTPISFAGPKKNFELFAGDPRILHLPVDYGRSGTLRDRLDSWPVLRRQLDQAGSVVVDPDSRLTQLGLLPVCPDERYFFFESRSYGGDGSEALPVLTAAWLEEVFGIAGARAFVAPRATEPRYDAAVSFGVGENREKRVADPFERDLLGLLSGRGFSVAVDRGAGAEEGQRVERAAAGLPNIHCWEGAFASFAALIGRSSLYIGYDSAGQHVAAAYGTPLISIFAGEASPRMFHRWRPVGNGRIQIIRATRQAPGAVLDAVKRAL